MFLGAINTRQTSEPVTALPPVGGLNGRDPLANMPAADAYLMDNIYPGVSSVFARNGYIKHISTPLGFAVTTLATYTGANGDQLLAWSGDKIFDISTSIPAELESGMVSPLAINAMFSNAADNSQHLISVTGFDVPKHYDGSAITDLTMTGITDPDDLNFVFTFKERLYFGARNTLGFYYLPVGQIQGALSYFDLAQVANKGGYLLAIASYSEGGETPQDYIVFITSKGELIVYAGYDPSNASTWELVGRYFGATPIGNRCTIPYNGDLLIITVQGVLSFSLIRSNGDRQGDGVTNSEYAALTTKLGVFLSTLNINADDAGWCGILHSRAGWLLINASTGGDPFSGYSHFIMNTISGAWCRFTGWNGICFEEFNGRLYFGNETGYVFLADEGLNDDGANITANVKTAYNYFADGQGSVVSKHFQWATLVCSATEPTVDFDVAFNVDFREVSQYDISPPFDGTVTELMLTLNTEGYAGSLHMSIVLNNQAFVWYATQYVLQRTQGLVP